ncbi:MAG: hypothetical protein HQL53_04165 [Magnetococcales bacterium]|nr:hypothetical protein [Magnetococcales bacterium]
MKVMTVKTSTAGKLGRDGGGVRYELGIAEGDNGMPSVQVRMVENIDSKGVYGRSWVAVSGLIKAAKDGTGKDGTFASSALFSACPSRSRNDPSFMAAILVQEGLVERAPEHRLRFTDLSMDTWIKQVTGNEGTDGYEKPARKPQRKKGKKTNG